MAVQIAPDLHADCSTTRHQMAEHKKLKKDDDGDGHDGAGAEEGAVAISEEQLEQLEAAQAKLEKASRSRRFSGVLHRHRWPTGQPFRFEMAPPHLVSRGAWQRAIACAARCDRRRVRRRDGCWALAARAARLVRADQRRGQRPRAGD